MTSTSRALWVALYDRLSAELNVPVYDSVPSGAAYPYVTRDSGISNEADALTETRDDRFITLTVWSTYGGAGEVLDILDGIRDAVHRRPLTLTSGRVVAMYVQRTRHQKDVDGRTYMGQATLRIWTET